MGMQGEFALGQRVAASRDISLEPYTTIKVGELGRVVYIHPGYIGVEVLLDKIHPGLSPWGNAALLCPPETEGLRIVLSNASPPPQLLRSVVAVRCAAACVLLALIIAATTNCGVRHAVAQTYYLLTPWEDG